MKPLFSAQSPLKLNSKVLYSDEVEALDADEKEFIFKTLSDDEIDEKLDLAKKIDKACRKDKLPIYQQSIKALSLVMCVACCLNTAKVGILDGTDKMFWAVMSAVFFFLLWGVMKIKENRIKKTVSYSDIISETQKLECEIDKINCALAVPISAEDTEVISICVALKDGEVQIKTGKDSDININRRCKIYSDIERIYLCDSSFVFAFLKDEIKELKRENKKLTISSWLKNEEIDDPRYESFNLNLNSSEHVVTDSFLYLVIEHENEEYAVYFPPYEEKILEKHTGLSAE